MRFDYTRFFEIGLTVFLFFLFFNSFMDYIRVNSNVSMLSFRLIDLKSKIYFLSKNIEKFVGPEIDSDLLDTQVRNILSLVKENETIVFWKECPGENLNVYYSRS